MADLKLEELKTDLANLQGQAAAISGAIQYIQQKIASLEKKEPKEEG